MRTNAGRRASVMRPFLSEVSRDCSLAPLKLARMMRTNVYGSE
jgi:hypothetical protein